MDMVGSGGLEVAHAAAREVDTQPSCACSAPLPLAYIARTKSHCALR